ncbi:MAG TPA: hypothetical protein PLN94_17070, partial [Thiolinea sp.]|nr:hypothetical protein [Thiolinea sp.]
MLLAHHYPRRWLARYRRQRGRYDHLTLGLYCRLWYATRQPADLLAWLRFRRDLGYGLPLRLRRALWQALPGLDGTRFWQGGALWLESGGDAARLAGLLVQQGRGGRDALAMLQNPLVLQGLVSQGMELPDADQQKLASLVRSQVAWQQAFRQALQQARAEGGVCVVGNAAGLRG